MSDLSQFHDQDNFSFMEENRPVKLPDMLNVLTILTFIGSAISIIASFYNYVKVCTTVKDLDALGEAGNMPFMQDMMASAAALATKSCELRLPLLIIGLLGAALCIFGAIKMRKFKKQGFILYVIGELGFPLVHIIMLFSVMSAFSLFTSLLIPVIFTILYATQLKHLK
jgi:hypothetical protein